jgi:hypothetical protein
MALTSTILTDLILLACKRATIGMDIYNFIFQAVRSRKDTNSYHTIPKVQNEVALMRFKDKHDRVSGNEDINHIYVFDEAKAIERKHPIWIAPLIL